MIRSTRLLMMVFLVVVTCASSIGTGSESLWMVGRYHQQSLWWQGDLFPRWNDTYVVVFEQEMLA
ncbi:hypothetical protein [Amphritea sp.]|uniref:hypothetical protein n=1 Tax=Amphritea sp. TaxID=1872502 RepID=UPI003D0FDA72